MAAWSGRHAGYSMPLAQLRLPAESTTAAWQPRPGPAADRYSSPCLFPESLFIETGRETGIGLH
jgi:hypothetical protein